MSITGQGGDVSLLILWVYNIQIILLFRSHFPLLLLLLLAGVPVGGKLSVTVCLICMKYRIIILIIIIKRLGEILLSYMANTSHTHARTHPVSMYFPSQHFMVLLVDDVVSRPITPEIHLLSLTIFTQEALVTLICMNLTVSYPNWYELK